MANWTYRTNSVEEAPFAWNSLHERFRMPRGISVQEISPGVYEEIRYYAYTDEIGAVNLPPNPNAQDTTFWPEGSTGLHFFRGGYEHIVSDQVRSDLIASGVATSANFTVHYDTQPIYNPNGFQFLDGNTVVATATTGAKTVTLKGPTRVFTEQKRPFTDSFSRVFSNGFGSSGGGGNYSTTGTDADYSVNGTRGVLALPVANSSRFATILDDLADVDVTCTVTLPVAPTGASSSIGLVFGYTTVNDNNRARLNITTAGTIQLALEKEVGGTVTTLGALTSVGTGFVGNDLWHIRAQRTGTTIRCRAWKDTDPEPGTWLHSVTEPNNPTGRVGFRFLASTGSTSLPRLFNCEDIQVVSGVWPVTPTVTHDTWVRVLPEPFNGRPDDALMQQISDWLADTSDDVLADAVKFITGAAPAFDGGVQVFGQSNYGPLNPDGTRQEGADFNDYMGVDWTFPDGEQRTADAPEAVSLDCSGYVRMVYGFHTGIPLTFSNAINGVNLPRTTANIGPMGPGVIVAQSVGSPPSLDAIRVGDVPHFDATSDGESTGQVDHNGIYLGVDSFGKMRFINSRKTPNGPTFGDLGGDSVLNGSGTYTTRLRIIRRF